MNGMQAAHWFPPHKKKSPDSDRLFGGLFDDWLKRERDGSRSAETLPLFPDILFFWKVMQFEGRGQSHSRSQKACT